MDPAELRPTTLEDQRAFLLRLARELVRCEAEAEDLVQETFAAALVHPPRASGALRAWLARVLRNLAVNQARSASRRARRERASARPESRPSHEEALEGLELQQRVLAAVRALDEPYRSTLWQRFYEERTNAQIARRDGVAPKTVESRVTRGLALLRGELDRRSDGDRGQWLPALLAWQASVPATPLTLLLGSALMKKLALAAVLSLLALLGWRAQRAGDSRSARDVSGSVALGAREGGNREATAPQREVLAPLAEAALPPPKSGAGLRVLVRWEDGSPAPDVGLFLHPQDDPRGPRAVLRVRSDAEGVARAPSIHPGPVRIVADRGGERTARVDPQGETEVVFELAAGLTVEGTVSDSTGAPIGAAELLLVTQDTDWLATRVVARTAPNGSYRLRSVQPELSVGARAEGFGPAALRGLHGRGGLARIDFVLAERPIGLRGIVLDPAREPVAGALVAVGDPDGYAVANDEQPGTWLQVRGLHVLETDEHGRFSAAGVLRGFGLAVSVQAEGYPIAVSNVDCEQGSTSFVEIVLAPPAALQGIVRDPSGAPVAGARVEATLLGGARAHDVPFALPATTSDAGGHYRLELVAPGSCTLQLVPPRASAGELTFVPLELAPGESRRDLVLSGDDAIRGRVEVAPGTPLDGWFVRALSLGRVAGTKHADVGADGSFELAHCDGPPYRVELYAARDRPLLRRDDVGPGPELVLVPEPLGSLRGEIEYEPGLLPPGVPPRVSLALRELVTHAPTAYTDGRFAFELLRPGRHRLLISQGERPLYARWIELAPGEHADAGRIRIEPPGSLVLDFVPWPSSAMGGAVRDGGLGTLAFLDIVGERLGVPALPPGEWTLDLDVEEHGHVCLPFRIRSGERTRLEVALEAGIERTLSFPVPEGDWNALRVTLRDAHGRVAFAREFPHEEVPGPAGGPSVLVRLPVGTFTVEALTDTGLEAEGVFDVPTLALQDAPLVFALR